MKLSAPIFQLKRQAKLMARNDDIPLTDALNQIARREGFSSWSLLSASLPLRPPSEMILSRLQYGDLLLLAARPGHGKTTLGLRLLLDAVCQGRQALLFTLELTERQARKQLRLLEADNGKLADAVQILTSDQISADYIMQQMSGLEKGSVAIIDYLQLLDQQRSKPLLCEQLEVLRAFAEGSDAIIGFISQVDRSFEDKGKNIPDIDDVRLPNFVNLRLFSKACFLHNGETRLKDIPRV